MTSNQDSRFILDKLDLLLRTGKILMENGADTSRIMRNLRRVAAFLGLPEESLHIYVNYSMLMVNLSDSRHSFAKFQRCKHHRINLDVLTQVSHLSWLAIKDNYTLSQFDKKLNRISRLKPCYSLWILGIGTGLACGGFCIQFGCDWIAFFYAAIAAMLGFMLRSWLDSKGSNKYVNVSISAFIATLTAFLFAMLSQHSPATSLLHSSTPWHPLMACSLFLVPYASLINFVSDILDGYVHIGIVRAVKTLMIILAMAFGIIFAIQVCGIDNFVRNLSMTPHHQYNEYILAAALTAIGFSMIYNTPKHLHWIVAVGGIIAVCTRNLIGLGASSGNVGLGLGMVLGSLCGAVLVSLICTRLVHFANVPHQCITIPSVIPLIPGVLMYRAMFDLVEIDGVLGEVTVAMYNAITASLIVLFIAIGVAIPNIFIRRMVRSGRRQRLISLLIQRRKTHGQFINLGDVEQNFECT